MEAAVNARQDSYFEAGQKRRTLGQKLIVRNQNAVVAFGGSVSSVSAHCLFLKAICPYTGRESYE